MSQTNIIFGGIVLAFVVFVVLRGEAPQYLDLFKHAKTQKSGGGIDAGSAFNDAAQVAQIASMVFV